MPTLKELREEIDVIDASIIKQLAERQKIVKKIGLVKDEIGKKIVDVLREDLLMDHYKQLAIYYQLDPNFVKKLFKLIINHSRKSQK